MTATLDITVLGLSLASSWGNGHATTYRSLLKGLWQRGHRIHFLERDVPWYRSHRDLADPEFARLQFYDDLNQLKEEHAALVRGSDAVVVGSYVPEGVEVGRWVCETAGGVTAFYDIDTPVTLAKLGRGDFEYLTPELIAAYDCYLSFTGGPVLGEIERMGSPLARPLYCSVDIDRYRPLEQLDAYDLGYLGTYSPDRQGPLQRMMLDAAEQWPEGRFAVAGPQYPADIRWSPNVERIEHLAPADHPRFYNAQRYTLNVTREDMIRAGYSPSVRLFEAAACGTPIISDYWPGLDEFFRPGQEIFISRSADETLQVLRELPEQRRLEVAEAACQIVRNDHSGERRADQFEGFIAEAADRRTRRNASPPIARPTVRHE